MADEMISAHVAKYLYKKFNPSKMNFLIWQNSFEYIFEISKVENKHKGKFLLHMVEPSVLEILQQCAPSNPDELSYDELIYILESLYSVYTGIRAIDYRFKHRIQLPNEPITHYVHELRELFRKTSFPIRVISNMKNKFIQGLKDKKIKNFLKQKGDISFAKAVSIAKRMELAKKNESEESSSE